MRLHAQGSTGNLFSHSGLRARAGIAAAALLAVSAMSGPAQAQDKITGVVKDAATQQPIAGATVYLMTAFDNQATTQADGSFSIDLPSTAVRNPALRRGAAPELNGTRLSFSVIQSGSRVSVSLLDLRGGLVRSLAQGRYAAGDYSLEAAPAGLPSGLYLLRAQVGSASRAFRLAAVGRAVYGSTSVQGNASAPRLAKAAAGGIDYLVVSAANYLKKTQEVMAYTDAQTVLLAASKPATTRMGVFTDSAMPMIDWAGATIYSWEQTAQLVTDSSHVGFNGSVAAMQISTMADHTWNGWAFHVAVGANTLQPAVDLSPYANGSMHLCVKGNAKSIGVMMSSKNQFAGSAPLVDLGTHGYLPDSAWHEITVPMSEFAGTLQLSDLFIYAGFVMPATMGGEFDPLATYWVDDIWFEPAK